MDVLVINAGSSSLKYQLIDMTTENVLASGNCERIGIDGRLTHKTGADKKVLDVALPDHETALHMVLDLLTGQDGVIGSLQEIGAVGHRIGTGWEGADKAFPIDAQVMENIEKTKDIAPLHTPAMLGGIKACAHLLGENIPQVAVFDTAFHQTMPPKAYIYPIPYEYYEQYGFRRYGYHGTSHKYVSRRCAKLMGKAPADLKIFTCHLGNVSSVAAIDGGKSVDTTMGYSPLEGVPMGTRSGTIDPALIQHIARKTGKNLDEVMDVLNKQSGLLGMSGLSSDDRDICEAMEAGNERAKLAASVVRYTIKKYIGAYAAAMNGLDAIVFTGGIGEHNPELRQEICGELSFFGVQMDEGKNTSMHGEGCVTTPGSKVQVWVIPTNEELMIARETYAVAGGQQA